MKDIKGIRLSAMLVVWACYWGFVFWAAKAEVAAGHHVLVNAVIIAIGLLGAWLTYIVACRRIGWARGDDSAEGKA
ncbi:hypothetical protein [Pseudooceanicola antarcticus]|nr:hypothetical protein [Pseudooceanicola antarcticus]